MRNASRRISVAARIHARPRSVAACAAVLAATLLTVACHDFDRPTAPRPSAGADRIAFVSDRDGTLAIYTMRSDGSDVRRLTTDPASTEPAWSPNRRWIAFVSTRDGNPEIYVMAADGSGQTRLTSDPANDRSPAWSPDGTRIAFVSDRTGLEDCGDTWCGRRSQLHVMNADGSGVAALGDPSDRDADPAWSPDGRRIAFGGSRGELIGLLVLDLTRAGPDRVRLLHRPAEVSAMVQGVAWSPDGRTLAFAFDGHVHRIAAEGGAAVSLAGGPPPGARAPSWSSDGRRLVFSQGNDLFVVNAGGGTPTQLTANPRPRSYDYPVWSPDGSRLAVVRRRGTPDVDASYELVTTSPDGTQPRSVPTDHPPGRALIDPAWSPDGRWIALRETGGQDLLLAHADGSGSVNLATGLPWGRKWIAAMSWEPDSRRIAVGAYHDDSSGVFAVHVDGGAVEHLSPPARQCYGSADWSPDGREIAYACLSPSSGWRVFTASSDGRTERDLGPLPVLPSWLAAPRWAPDGRTLAFAAPDAATGGPALFLLRADGGGIARVIPTPRALGALDDLRWSPGGDRIAFTGRLPLVTPHGPPQTYAGVLDLATGAVRALAPTDGEPEAHPTWSPDGRRVAWAAGVATRSWGPGPGAIYTAAPDGSDVRRVLAAVPATACSDPAW